MKITRRLAGHDRVMSTSTYLDSLRFRVHLAERLGVSPACVDANVVGEHGTSSVFLWSSARIGGMSVAAVLAEQNIGFEEFRKAIEEDVRYANITIIEGTGASQYGIGMVAGRVAEVILRDELAVMPVGSHNERYGITLSLPSIVGKEGVKRVLWPDMSPDETAGLERSAERLKSVTRKSQLKTNLGPNAALIGMAGSRAQLATPCLVLDRQVLARNIKTAADFCRERDIALRPHGKSHKCAAIAALQLKGGAAGLCVATVGEAEAMARAEITDLLITSTFTQPNKFLRVASLAAARLPPLCRCR